MIQAENPQHLRLAAQVAISTPISLRKPNPTGSIDALLKVARWSGSASNRQHWELVVIQDKKTLQATGTLARLCGHLAGAALGIVLVWRASQNSSYRRP